MKNSSSMKKVTGLALSVAIGSGLWAAANTAYADSGVYIGAAYGLGRVDGGDFKDDTSVLKAFVGAKLNSYVGIEGGIHDFGGADNNGFRSDLTGKSLALTGFMPLGESFELFAKVGNLWWESDVKYLGLTNGQSGRELFYGAGVNLNFNPSLALRLEFERYKVELTSDEVGINIDGTTDVDVASVGIVFAF
jgi:OOP family OmpA-OmpF porin